MLNLNLSAQILFWALVTQKSLQGFAALLEGSCGRSKYEQYGFGDEKMVTMNGVSLWW